MNGLKKAVIITIDLVLYLPIYLVMAIIVYNVAVASSYVNDRQKLYVEAQK